MSIEPTALLISLRDPHDAMAAHEQRCFAEAARLPLHHVHLHPMVHGSPSASFIRRHDAVFFGGSGAYSVLDDTPWILEALDLLQRVVELRVPSWASCFGFQGLSRALGGEVIRDDERTEMGSTLLHRSDAGRADPLFATLPDDFWAQEGHHDRVVTLPPGVTLLAWGDVCHEQAFRVDGAPFWASQFHPELTVQRTVDRFHHYRDHYLDDGEADGVLASLLSGAETDEVGAMLAHLVRGRI